MSSRGAAWHRGTLFSHGSRFAGCPKGIAGRVTGSLKKYLLAQYGIHEPSEGLDQAKNPGAGTVQQQVGRFGHHGFVSLSLAVSRALSRALSLSLSL
jgi:hypothetical protein